MAIVSRRRYAVVAGIVVLLTWAVVTSSFWTNDDVSVIQTGDGPLLVDSLKTGRVQNPQQAETARASDSGGNNVPKSGDSNADNVVMEAPVQKKPEDMEEEMQNRNEVLAKECDSMRHRRPQRPLYEHVYAREAHRHLIFNKRKQVMYCYLPKVANTNFRRIFLGLEGVIDKEKVSEVSGYDVYFVLRNKLHYLPQIANHRDRSMMLQSYRKFMVVRDPLERLLSGYRNKFFHPNKDHQWEYHEKYLEFYDTHVDLKKERTIRRNFTGKPLTFQEFVTYFIDSFDTSTFINEHFTPAYLLCHPCEIHFDYIGKYESIDRDAAHIFEKLNIDIPFPARNDNYSAVPTELLARQFYEPLPGDLLKKLLSILQPDFSLFGYALPDWFSKKIQL